MTDEFREIQLASYITHNDDVGSALPFGIVYDPFPYDDTSSEGVKAMRITHAVLRDGLIVLVVSDYQLPSEDEDPQ